MIDSSASHLAHARRSRLNIRPPALSKKPGYEPPNFRHEASEDDGSQRDLLAKRVEFIDSPFDLFEFGFVGHRLMLIGVSHFPLEDKRRQDGGSAKTVERWIFLWKACDNSVPEGRTLRERQLYRSAQIRGTLNSKKMRPGPAIQAALFVERPRLPFRRRRRRDDCTSPAALAASAVFAGTSCKSAIRRIAIPQPMRRPAA